MKKTTAGTVLADLVQKIIDITPGKMTQKAVAKMVGVGEAYLSQMLRAEREGNPIPEVFIEKVRGKYDRLLIENEINTTDQDYRDWSTDQIIQLRANVSVLQELVLQMLTEKLGAFAPDLRVKLTTSVKLEADKQREKVEDELSAA